MPHTVEFVVDKSESMRAPKDWQWSRKSMHSRPMPRVYAVDYIVDEQGNNVTFATKDAFVQGGGVIHTINAVRRQICLDSCCFSRCRQQHASQPQQQSPSACNNHTAEEPQLLYISAVVKQRRAATLANVLGMQLPHYATLLCLPHACLTSCLACASWFWLLPC
jgi:hypothetical protein